MGSDTLNMPPLLSVERLETHFATNQGVLRAVSDTPSRPLDGLADGVKADGGYDWPALARAFARSPRGFVRSASDAQRALGRLGDTAKGWSR